MEFACRGVSMEFRGASVGFSHVFAYVAWKFHRTFHIESHGISMEQFHVFSSWNSMGYRTGTPYILQDRRSRIFRNSHSQSMQ